MKKCIYAGLLIILGIVLYFNIGYATAALEARVCEQGKIPKTTMEYVLTVGGELIPDCDKVVPLSPIFVLAWPIFVLFSFIVWIVNGVILFGNFIWYWACAGGIVKALGLA
jgi:hypothetical protein